MVLLNSELFSVNIGFSVSRRFDAFSKNSPTFGETKRKKKKKKSRFRGKGGLGSSSFESRHCFF